jgi:hypothetical protein
MIGSRGRVRHGVGTPCEIVERDVRRTILLALVSTALLAPAEASAADCVSYPGDDAPKELLARWMGYGAAARSLPGELPVMAALVESNLKNLDYAGADSLGFFAMRTSVWNTGEYAGFATNPPLQLDWFLDQAAGVLADNPNYATSDVYYGEWVADVQRPAEQYRYRYQLRLTDARTLIGPGCVPDGGMSPPPDNPDPPDDTTPPEPEILRPRALRRIGGVAVTAGCPVEACRLVVEARLFLPGAARVHRVRSRPRELAAGVSARIAVRFGARLRVRLAKRRAAGRHLRAAVRVIASDAAGNRAVALRRVRLF